MASRRNRFYKLLVGSMMIISTDGISCATYGTALLLVVATAISAKRTSEDVVGDRSSDDASQQGLVWNDLSVQVVATPRFSKNGSICILHPCSGFVANGRLCGILGPSGSGKSKNQSFVTISQFLDWS